MSIIGAPAVGSFSAPTSQVANGGSATYTLNTRVNSAEELEVFVNNVQQEPTVAYSVASDGVSLTFTETTPSGTGTVYFVFRGLAQQHGTDIGAPRLIGNNTFTGNQTVTGDLTATGAFTSKGIDDNADATSITINSSENVGIKTTSPSAPLHVDSDNGFGNIMISRDGGVAGRRNFGLGVTGGADESLYLTCSPDTNHANVFANTYKSVMGFNVGDVGAVRAFLQPLTVVRYSSNTHDGAYNSGSNRNAVVCKPTNVEINQGSNFNTSTGQFTCPVNGTYRVAFMGNFYGNGISNYILIQIRKNGARVDQAYQKNLTTDWMHMIRVAYVTCSANDTLEVYNNADSSGGTKGGWDTHWYTAFNYSLVI